MQHLLTQPIKCSSPYAWLCVGYYFWANEIDTVKWGNDCKKHTLRYQIYKADIECEDVLDTDFNAIAPFKEDVSIDVV